MNTFILLNLFSAFIIGIVIGIAELMNKYPDTKLLFNTARFLSISYILFNGIIATSMLVYIWHFKGIELEKILYFDFQNVPVAGLGGMALLRSSLFSVNINGKDIEIGFVQIIKTFFKHIEKNIYDKIARIKLKRIPPIVKDCDFENMHRGIVAIGAKFSPHLTNEETANLENLIEELSNNSSLKNSQKMIILGDEISNLCSIETLESIIKALKEFPEENDKSSLSQEEIENLLNSIKISK